MAISEKIILEECTKTSLVLFNWNKNLVFYTHFQAITAAMSLIYQYLTMNLKTLSKLYPKTRTHKKIIDKCRLKFEDLKLALHLAKN